MSRTGIIVNLSRNKKLSAACFCDHEQNCNKVTQRLCLICGYYQFKVIQGQQLATLHTNTRFQLHVPLFPVITDMYLLGNQRDHCPTHGSAEHNENINAAERKSEMPPSSTFRFRMIFLDTSQTLVRLRITIKLEKSINTIHINRCLSTRVQRATINATLALRLNAGKL